MSLLFSAKPADYDLGQQASPPSPPDALAFSRRSTQPSQTPAVPRFPSNILNGPASAPPAHNLRVDRSVSGAFLDELARVTGGCSIEQLEQVYSALMNAIWRTRGDWDRIGVVNEAKSVLQELLDDMEQCQRVGPLSHEELGRQEILRPGSNA